MDLLAIIDAVMHRLSRIVVTIDGYGAMRIHRQYHRLDRIHARDEAGRFIVDRYMEDDFDHQVPRDRRMPVTAPAVPQSAPARLAD